MKARIFYLLALLFLVFVSAGATTKREGIHMFYQPQENGDYKLYLFPTGKLLVCEEQPLKLIEPADPTHDPIVIECTHEAHSWIKNVRPK